MGQTGAKVRATKSRQNFSQQATRSTPLDPNLMFRCVSYHLGAFGTIWLLTKLGTKWAEQVQKFVPQSRVGIFRNQRTRSRWTLNSCFVLFVPFRCILNRLVALQNSVQKGAKVVQKFLPRSCIGIFRNERTRSTPWDPKLMFWCISYRLRAFGTVMLLYKTRGKTFRTSAKVRATMLRRIISQWTHPIQPIGP